MRELPTLSMKKVLAKIEAEERLRNAARDLLDALKMALESVWL